MPKNVPAHLIEKSKKCAFCGRSGLTRTHIWPDWLSRLLPSGQHRLFELDEQAATPTDPDKRLWSKLNQGSIFTQKPYLACLDCNTGWMKRFEDEVLTFAKRLFISNDPIVLNRRQTQVLAGWSALITILAEFMVPGCLTIPVRDRVFLKVRSVPPPHWSIAAASMNAPAWAAKYRHQTSFVGQFASREEYFAAVERGRDPNTQMSSLGMGKLFVQVFTCPNERLVLDFRKAARKAGMVDLWPTSAGLQVWPFKQGAAKFPTLPILDNHLAEQLSNEFFDRMRLLTTPPYFGGQFVPL